jgi:hypothetical protein
MDVAKSKITAFMLLALFSSKLATATAAINDAYVSALVATSLATVTAAISAATAASSW